MKIICPISVILVVLISGLFCSKSGGSASSVTYELFSPGGTWGGEYENDSNGVLQIVFVQHQPDGWKYSFSVSHGQYVPLWIAASPDNIGTVKANIFVNGSLVATDSSKDGVSVKYSLNH